MSKRSSADPSRLKRALLLRRLLLWVWRGRHGAFAAPHAYLQVHTALISSPPRTPHTMKGEVGMMMFSPTSASKTTTREELTLPF